MFVDTLKVKVEVKSPNFRRDLEKLIQSEEGFHIGKPDNNDRADLLIFELGDDSEKELQDIIHS